MTTTAATPITATELDAFVEALNRVGAENHAKRGYTFAPTTYSVVTGGIKFLRIVAQHSGTSRSAFLFVEVSTGDLYKAASWKDPARNFPRGNIPAGKLGEWRWDTAKVLQGAVGTVTVIRAPQSFSNGERGHTIVSVARLVVEFDAPLPRTSGTRTDIGSHWFDVDEVERP
jgi:hypothetical protein